MLVVVVMMLVCRDDDGNKDGNHLETKILEAAQATRYPPEADQEESKDWLKHKLKMVKRQWWRF